MKKTISIIVLALLLISCGAKLKGNDGKPGKDGVSSKTVTITSDEVKDIVAFLASDDLEGRDTGSAGIESSAKMIEYKFKEMGLKPYFDATSYRDNFKIGEMDAFNVVGYLEGSDSKLKEEFIIIGAHYDHIGIGKDVNGDTIANGANDNAAGTSAVLSLAKYFAAKKNNKRSLLFVTFTAEEKGLLGSKHLAERLKEQNFNLYTMFNIEMIGVPFKARDYEAFVSGYELSNFAEKANEYAGNKLLGFSEVSKKYSLFKRSDNYPFYQAFKVPSHTVSSCDLTNFDFYHHVDDEIDKLDYPFMASLINKMAPVIEAMSNTATREIRMNDN
ncbi:M20/M25/M40 family metallo-hydrolase [uncultured Lacinutrix sp.]|uniref:M28 family metallopeptidase n=1 Tax=uncultured Lacinutrix sp. TaxID=574032 RepID=UPI00261BCFE5|nr:M20/M25/M40 family metallo-hydrolase [uncultured Lacinutrix sp.]